MGGMMEIPRHWTERHSPGQLQSAAMIFYCISTIVAFHYFSWTWFNLPWTVGFICSVISWRKKQKRGEVFVALFVMAYVLSSTLLLLVLHRS